MGLAPLFGLEPEEVRVISPYVGGGFRLKDRGSRAGRACSDGGTRTARSRREGDLDPQQMSRSAVTVHRPSNTCGSEQTWMDTTAVVVDVVEQSSRTKEFTEGSDGPARMMYAAPQRRTTNRPAARCSRSNLDAGAGQVRRDVWA